MVLYGSTWSINSWVRGVMIVRFVTPGMRSLHFNRLVLVFVIVVSSLSVNVVLSRFLGAWCCFLGLTCLSIVFRSTSKLVYGSYHLFTEKVCRNNTWIDQLFPGFNFECWCSEVTMWGGGCLVVLIPQGPTLWPDGVVEFSGWVITWWAQFPKWTWVD